jgi:hypothetical protein
MSVRGHGPLHQSQSTSAGPQARNVRSVLTFVVPIAHPANMADPARRADLLLRTLSSLVQQDDPNFRVIVVGVPEALPEVARVGPKVKFVPVSFPPASVARKPSWSELWTDKGAKLAVGIAAARRAGSTHIMPVDSDDFVSGRLAGYVAAHPGHPGWYSSHGYLHVVKSRKLIEVVDGFHMRCGSSHIVATTDHPVGPDLDSTLSRSEVVEWVGNDVITHLLGAHRSTVEFLAERGSQLDPLPFPAAIWEIGSGENYTQMLNSVGGRVDLDGDIAGEFGMPVPSRVEHFVGQASNISRRILKLRTPTDR